MRTVYVQPGDTIIRLAVRHLDDAGRWPEIVELNGLGAPYVSDDPAPFVAQGLSVRGPGEPLLIPVEAGQHSYRTQAQAEYQTYKIDLGWQDLEADLLYEGDRPGLDRGLRNLIKALYRRLITRPGQLPAHPDYGCKVHQHVGKTASAWRARLAALDVKAALEGDPRVQAVTAEVVYNPDGDLRITAYVTPIPPSETGIRLDATIGGTLTARAYLT